MAKKKNKQAPKETQNKGVENSQKAKNVQDSKNNVDDFIDDIFANKKRKIETVENKEPVTEKLPKKAEKTTTVEKVVFSEKPLKSLNNQIAADDEFFDSRGNKGKRKTTEEGFLIYSSKELNIGAGEGDTKDCPFDCQCCF